jgi:hypothetical protein
MVDIRFQPCAPAAFLEAQGTCLPPRPQTRAFLIGAQWALGCGAADAWPAMGRCWGKDGKAHGAAMALTDS